MILVTFWQPRLTEEVFNNNIADSKFNVWEDCIYIYILQSTGKLLIFIICGYLWAVCIIVMTRVRFILALLYFSVLNY